MIRCRTILILIVILGFSLGHNLQGQQLKKVISGIVTDRQTSKPIPYVYVLSSIDGTVTNDRGKFSVGVKSRDAIHFSHVGYNKHYIRLVGIADDTVNVNLAPRERMLDEVTINSFYTIDVFKNQLLNHQLILTTEEVNAKNNLDNIKVQYLSGYRPAMNAYENYRAFIAGPQPVTFFTTGPSGGLFRAIKSLSKTNSDLVLPAPISPLSADSLWLKKNLLESDSIPDH
jgi:CarboxypepD_reg-like domain